MKGALARNAHDDFHSPSTRLNFSPTTSREKVVSPDKSVLPRHWRSNSAPDEEACYSHWDISPRTFSQVKEDLKRLRENIDQGKALKHNKNSGKKECIVSLEQDVKHLQKRLKDQRATKDILEQALARPSSVLIPFDDNFVSQHTQGLIKDIAVLEVEVSQLEQYLLSLYRKVYEMGAKNYSCTVEESFSVLRDVSAFSDNRSHQLPEWNLTNKTGVSANIHAKSGSLVPSTHAKTLFGSIGNHSFTESKNKAINAATTPKKGGVGSSYSQPILPSRKEAKGSPSAVTCELWREVISAEDGASCTLSEATVEQMSETPNKLSEELVRCMAAIYCKLADPPIPYLGGSVSPSSSLSSTSTFSPKEVCSDGWSPFWRTDVLQANASHRKIGSESSSMVEVHWICVDNDRLTYAAKMIQNFRYLVQQLERVDPGQLRHEEKLAFWLNIYNALMMHAYLAYGIPRSHLKRVSLLQKAAYKIGAHSISAHTIEHSVLGCRSHRPAQWIQLLFKMRGSHRQTYSLERPEPLVCFAICCGGRSDPAVRVYTPKNVYHELDCAKRDFLQANVTVRKESKILLPRILEAFARDSSMGSFGLLEWICQNVAEKKQLELKRCISMKSHRCIEWIPYSFNFRYLFVRDLARWFPPNSA